ncbi:MAG: hypothetical protein ABGF52_10860 [Candidatus Asgardarchaeum sp.]
MLRKIAEEEFKEKRPKIVEIRMIRNATFLRRKVKTLTDWYKKISKYIMCSRYTNEIRVYFLTQTGHMFSAITFRDNDIKYVEMEINRKTKLIYAIKEKERREPTLEELAQILLDRINRFLINSSKKTGAKGNINLWTINIVDDTDEKMIKIDTKQRSIIVKKVLCKEPHINYVARIISYFILFPDNFLIYHGNFVEKIVQNIVYNELNPSQKKEFTTAFNLEEEQLIMEQLPPLKELFSLIYLIEKYEESRLNTNDIKEAINLLKITHSHYDSLAKMYLQLFNNGKEVENLVKSIIIFFISKNFNMAKELLRNCSQNKLCKIAKDIIDYNISSVRREYDNYRASYKNIKRMITDAIELIRNTAFSVDVTDISLEEEKSCVIYLTITNKTDLPLYNVSVVLQKWVPPKNIEFKNLHKRIDMIESKKAAIIPFEMTIFKEHISEVIMKRLLIFGFDDNGDQYSTIKENIKIKIPIREKNNINKAS